MPSTRKGTFTPLYLTIGYGNREGYDRTPATLRDTAHSHDQTLVARGAVMGMAGAPVQVRNPEGQGVQTLNAAFMGSDLPVAGFALIEAASLEDAVEMAAQTPCTICYGVVEIWPLVQDDVG